MRTSITSAVVHLSDLEVINLFLYRASQAHVARPSMASASLFALASYDPETLSVATTAFEDAWLEYRTMLRIEPLDAKAKRSEMAKRIIAAMDEGQRDPAQLKWIALQAI